MKYSKIPLAQTLVHHCKSIGISHIVISPGSRNAPLILGFTNDPYFSCYSIVDERSAGFFALGMAQQLQKPVCVLCTSGSALLNYHPAVAEAYYSRIPLVVLSADRPAYKIDIGDGQTIRQAHVFKNHLVYSANLKQDVEHATETLRQCNPDFLPEDGLADEQFRIQQYNETEINTSLQKAILFNQPVHINAPFEEPLYEVSNESRLKFGEFVPKTLKNDKEPGFDAHLEVWNKSKRKMVLIGSNYPDSILQKHLDALAGDESILVFTETTSNVHHQNFFPSIDSIIAPIEISDQSNQLFEKLRPEVLLTFGGLIVSKKIKAFLRNYAPEHHWHVDPHIAHDTYFALSHHYKTNVNAFFDALLVNNPSSQSNYRDYWSSRKTHYINKLICRRFPLLI
jgi:2-succinyl-5-enolpyruvyl-6-hydroxy-3-cyclohexene-1-carboxylate synthase